MPGQTEGQKERRVEGGRTDRQTLFYRTLPDSARGPKIKLNLTNFKKYTNST